MPLAEILEDLLSNHTNASLDPREVRMEAVEQQVHTLEDDDISPESLLASLQNECNASYRDPGHGLQYVGLLLAVFAAELVSAFWKRNVQQNGRQIGDDQVGNDRGPARMVSCLYSKDKVGFVLSHPPENQNNTNTTYQDIWGTDLNGVATKVEPTWFKDVDYRNLIYTVSAAVRIGNDNTQNPRPMPFFGCPRLFHDPSTGSGAGDASTYIRERFEENDLLPTFVMATSESTVETALDVIFSAHPPQDTSMALSPDSPAAEDWFLRQQFTRGFGNHLDWLNDPSSLQNAKLDIDTQNTLASSKVIGVFGSISRPNVLFQQDKGVGLYSQLSKEYILLSQNSDFFEAGLQYSTYNDSDTSPHPTAEQDDEPLSPLSAEPMEDIQPEKLKEILNVPSHMSVFFPVPGQQKQPQTPLQAPESPSFFSPSFAQHLNSSSASQHDPRIHTVSLPLNLKTPIRSQSYPTTPSPARSGQVAGNFQIGTRSPASYRSLRRPSDIPPPNITPISPQELLNLLSGDRPILLLDIRAFAAFAKSRLVDAINVCIPTVLLKRSSLSLDDITESVVSITDRARFSKWKEADGIVIYDADSLRVKDSYPVGTLASKFIEAGFQKATYGLSGGFASLSDTPSLIDVAPLTLLKPPQSTSSTPQFVPAALATRPTGADATTRLALECKESPLFPTTKPSTSAPGAPAFFSNIRQNMDLHGGVGPLIPIEAPQISGDVKALLPNWIVQLAYSEEGPQLLADRWESIELAEKQRLENVLTRNGMSGKFSIAAAMERGEKNRYPNIWPYEHNRVKIPSAESGKDYFNGSVLTHELTGRRYIATQAPLPSTFEDFWKIIWGEGVQIIVCLTAIEEGGQVKCHPYWRQMTVGEIHVIPMQETIVSLGAGATTKVRTLMLQNRAEPFASMREIIQIHYEGWPDFGTPAQAATIVALIKLMNDFISQRGKSKSAPILVHCSAGCGRTGTFCTVDGVISSIDGGLGGGEEDLVYRNVLQIREQRMSLVQTLRQYVLCYECVLHHLISKVTGQ